MFLFPFITLRGAEQAQSRGFMQGTEGRMGGKKEKQAEEKQVLSPRTCLSISFPSL